MAFCYTVNLYLLYMWGAGALTLAFLRFGELISLPPFC